MLRWRPRWGPIIAGALAGGSIYCAIAGKAGEVALALGLAAITMALIALGSDD